MAFRRASRAAWLIALAFASLLGFKLLVGCPVDADDPIFRAAGRFSDFAAGRLQMVFRFSCTFDLLQPAPLAQPHEVW